MKILFFSRKKHSFVMSSNISQVEIFLIFSAKNFIIRAEKTFLRNHTIRYAFYSKFATLSVLKKIQDFFGKTHLFFRKTQILNVLRNLTISVALYGNFAIQWWKFSCSETWTNIVNANGRHRVKNAPFEWNILLPYFLVMAQYTNDKPSKIGSWMILQNFMFRNFH